MKNNVRHISVGKQFRFNDKTYVRIPEINIRCDTSEFTVNVIYIEPQPDPGFGAPLPNRIIADFLHPDTIVEVLPET